MLEVCPKESDGLYKYDTEAQRLRERQNLFFLFTATTTARETENGVEDGLAKPKPFAFL